MTRDEVKKLVATIATAWPAFHRAGREETPAQEKSRKAAIINIWHYALADYEADYIAEGLKKLLVENVYPPVIAEVVNAAREAYAAAHDIMANPALAAQQAEYVRERQRSQRALLDQGKYPQEDTYS